MTFDSIVKKVNSYGDDYEPEPRDLPLEELIERTYFTIEDPICRAQYGYQAAFGFRNHELYKANTEPLLLGQEIIYVREDTKTGFRVACALYPEWIEIFSLRTLKLPPPRANYENWQLGGLVTAAFKRANIPFSPYALRHCWARRSIAFGMDPRIAALCMGHSLETHFDTYCHWFTEEEIKRELERIKQNPNRPMPPSMRKPPQG